MPTGTGEDILIREAASLTHEPKKFLVGDNLLMLDNGVPNRGVVAIVTEALGYGLVTPYLRPTTIQVVGLLSKTKSSRFILGHKMDTWDPCIFPSSSSYCTKWNDGVRFADFNPRQLVTVQAERVAGGKQTGPECLSDEGWLFSYDPFWRPPQMKALLHSVPLGKLVVLDLFAEVKPIWITSEQFYGVPYIWCMLHNFAGNIEMYGILDAIASGPIDARTSENSTMVGVGMSMEGIEQNPIVYDLMSEMAFLHKKVDVKAWIDLYPARRYGRSVASVKDAWNILYYTIYNCTDGANDKNRDVIVAFPDVDPSLISIPQEKYSHYENQVSRRSMLKPITESFDQPHLWYSTSEVIRALELFLKSGDELSGSNTYRYDLIDLTRQALAKYANQLFLKAIEAYQSNNVQGVTHYSHKFLDLVDDFDTLLACHEGFLLGPWLESAKQLAQDENQEKQFEWNARTQITMWFDNSDEEPSLLRDYGNKYWSGLLRDYYGPRAGIYFKFLIKSLEEGNGFSLKGWRREWIKLTNDWQSSRNVFPVKGAGDAVNTSRWLFNKYLQTPDNIESLNDAAAKYVI